jgi:hypothetical protein
MKLSIFQSDKGDCFLLTGKDGKRVLCDGGMGPSMEKHVRPVLGKLKELEYIYVSHVDNDHINGILTLLENEAEWRIHEHKKKKKQKTTAPPFPRPPKIKGILHNGFSHLIGETDKPIDNLANAFTAAEMLGNAVPALLALELPEATHAAEEMENFALGVKESVGVSQLIHQDALNIPLNKPLKSMKEGRLLRVGGQGDRFKVGGMTWTLLGPTDDELTKLRDGWMNYLKSATGKKQVAGIRAQIKKQVDAFSNGALNTSPFDLGGWNGIADYKHVTVPNISSMVFMVEEGPKGKEKRLLLTGDAHQDFILRGLEQQGFVTEKGAIHVDVLKVQHHGSEHNMDKEFARRVSADHYVFGCNGEHKNPDERVLEILFNSRRGDAEVLAQHDKADGREFHWWFSTTSKEQAGKKHAPYFREVEKMVKSYVSKSNGLLKAHYNTGSFVDLDV